MLQGREARAGWQRGRGKCYWGRIWRLEGKMELGWALSGQERCSEGGRGSGIGLGGAGRMDLAGFDTGRLGEMG